MSQQTLHVEISRVWREDGMQRVLYFISDDIFKKVIAVEKERERVLLAICLHGTDKGIGFVIFYNRDNIVEAVSKSVVAWLKDEEVAYSFIAAYDYEINSHRHNTPPVMQLGQFEVSKENARTTNRFWTTFQRERKYFADWLMNELVERTNCVK